jgi:hypothetical protein
MAHVDELRDCAIRRLMLAEEARAKGDLDFAERLTALAIQYLDDANRISVAEFQADNDKFEKPEDPPRRLLQRADAAAEFQDVVPGTRLARTGRGNDQSPPAGT